MNDLTFTRSEFIEFFKSIADMYKLRKEGYKYSFHYLLLEQVEKCKEELSVNFFIISNGLKVTFNGRFGQPSLMDNYIIISVSGYDPDNIYKSKNGAGNVLNSNVDDKLKRLIIDNANIFNRKWGSVK